MTVRYLGKNIRLAAGESVRGLAKKAHIAPSTISKWENGNSVPDLLVLAQVAGALKVKIDDLVRLEGD